MDSPTRKKLRNQFVFLSGSERLAVTKRINKYRFPPSSRCRAQSTVFIRLQIHKQKCKVGSLQRWQRQRQRRTLFNSTSSISTFQTSAFHDNVLRTFGSLFSVPILQHNGIKWHFFLSNYKSYPYLALTQIRRKKICYSFDDFFGSS
mgnify:CR=1 FL=1